MSGVSYTEFLERKSQTGEQRGFEPLWVPDFLFDFQRALVEWAIRKGRGAIFADCGLGKTPMQLVWAENVVRKTNRPVLILTPLAVASQTIGEAHKFEIETARLNGECPTPARPMIYVTNYEKLHHFESEDFAGVVCDESSILKHFSGATQKAVTRFMSKVSYRLLCTATAAPNDYIELGTSSEALGELGYSDMLSRFFRQMDNKKPSRMNDVKASREARAGNHYAKLAYRISQQIGQWRLKGHAITPFWRWIASWARACRKPSDLGFSDDAFRLPELEERQHVIEPRTPASGYLFTVPAFGLKEEREERRRTLDERCELVAQLVAHDRPAVVWCHLNAEGNRLVKAIPGSRQVRGSDTNEQKEDAYRAFKDGSLRVLIIKPKIGAWGLNWEHCNHVVTFASHSYEQFYQSVRRCWRFGQKRPVMVDVIATEGERHVLDNMLRKQGLADAMFEELVLHMNDALRVERRRHEGQNIEVPAWL